MKQLMSILVFLAMVTVTMSAPQATAQDDFWNGPDAVSLDGLLLATDDDGDEEGEESCSIDAADEDVPPPPGMEDVDVCADDEGEE